MIYDITKRVKDILNTSIYILVFDGAAIKARDIDRALTKCVLS